jgi:hypothetical protein
MDAEARKEEILAKKAKLEELRRARALREQEMRKNRSSVGEGGDVWQHLLRVGDMANSSVVNVSYTNPRREAKRY